MFKKLFFLIIICCSCSFLSANPLKSLVDDSWIVGQEGSWWSAERWHGPTGPVESLDYDIYTNDFYSNIDTELGCDPFQNYISSFIDLFEEYGNFYNISILGENEALLTWEHETVVVEDMIDYGYWGVQRVKLVGNQTILARYSYNGIDFSDLNREYWSEIFQNISLNDN